jgi:hypothetical protein
MKRESIQMPESGAGLSKPLESEPDRFVTAKELLEQVLPVGRGRLRRMCQSGLVPYIKPNGGRKLLFHIPSVKDALLRLQRSGDL